MELSYIPNNPAEDGRVYAGVVAPEEAEAMRSFIYLRSYTDGYKGSAGKGFSIDVAQHTMQELEVALGVNDGLHPCPFNLTADRYQQELSSSRFSAAAAYFCVTNPGELLKQRSLSPLGEFRARIGIEGFDNTLGLPRGIPLAEFFPKKKDTVTEERVSSATRAAAELLSGPPAAASVAVARENILAFVPPYLGGPTSVGRERVLEDVGVVGERGWPAPRSCVGIHARASSTICFGTMYCSLKYRMSRMLPRYRR
jgi:hypothetical protein